MRNLYLYLLPAFLALSCSDGKKNGGFELTGQLSNTNNEKLYLERLASTQPLVVDSAEIDDEGRFSFESYTPAIGFYRVRQNQQNFAMLVLDSNDKVKITGNLADLGNSYKVEGSGETSLFLEYNNIARRRDQQLDSMNNIVQNAMEPNKNDTRKMDSITAQLEGPYNRIVESSNQALVSKIMANTDKYSSIMAIQALEPDKYPEVYKALNDGLGRKFPYDPNVKVFQDVVKRVLSLGIGQTAPEIGLPSPGGEVIYLSQFRGKVVLIDFWASWCGPCRREMPTVVKAYEKYKNKGFEIFGVSLDQDKNRWVEAIASDKITWPQVSDLKNWQSDAARAYNVQSIPYTVLLDREGRILAKNLRGEELDRKLAEVLSKPAQPAAPVVN
jgi:thiol-disulfide isomerase/thioredoxin